jgi:3-dehydroquinate dehydratase/shikimate dehydrogenase
VQRSVETDEHRLALFLMERRAVRICVPVCVRRVSDLPQAVARAAEVADIIELRLDCLDEDQLGSLSPDLALFRRALRPIILTMRPKELGRHSAVDRAKRVKFWSGEGRPVADFVDVEADLLISTRQDAEIILARLERNKTICSHHDFARVPSNLEELYERMVAIDPHIVKIAVRADDVTDCLPVFHLLERARSEGREVIAIAMGDAGIATRILGPSRGAFLTYASLDDESATAEGQLTARELREVYRIDQIDAQTEITGLVGRPAGHSISPHMQNAAFASAGVKAVYIPFEVRDVSAFMGRMAHPRSREIDWKLRGLSITAPHKSAVMQHLDWIDPRAKEIGAVNTIVVEGSELHGYNTDAEGFIRPLRKRFEPLEGLRCAVIGAGGAARSAIWALRTENASVSLFVRDLKKGRGLAEEFGVDCHHLQRVDFTGFDIVVNTTPLGTRGDMEAETIAAGEQLRGVQLVYDLVYNPIETKLLREAAAAGCEVLGGLQMLIAQAALQFKLWTGKEPDTDAMRTAALSALKESKV